MADYGALRIGVTADTKQAASSISKDLVAAGEKAGSAVGQTIGKGISGATGAIGKALGTVTKVTAGVLGTATLAATGFGIAAFATAARVGEMDATLRALSKGNTTTYKSMTDTVTAVRKTGIEAGVAQGLVAQFSRNNLDLAKSTDLARVAQDAAVISGKNSTETLESLVHGITTQNSMVLRNAGINVQAGDAMDKYATSLGKTTKELSDSERAQAVLNAVIAAGGPIAGAYASAMEEPGKVLRSFPRVFDDIKLSVGKGLVDAFGPLILKVYNFTKALSESLMPGGALAPVIAAIGTAAGKLVEPMTKVIGKLTEWTKNLKPAQFKGIADAIGKFAPQIAAVATGLATFAGGNITGAIPIVGKLLGNLGGPLGAVVAGIAVLVATTPELRSAFGDVIKAAQPLLGVLMGIGKDLVAAVVPALASLGGPIASIGQALFGAVGTILKAVAPLAPILGKLAGQLLSALGPALKTLGPLLTDIGNQIGKALGNAIKSLQPLLPSISTAFTLIGGALKVVFAVLGPGISVLVSLIGWLLKGPLGTILLAIAAAIGIWAAAQAILNIVLAANPIGLLVIAIAALIGGIVLAIRNIDTIKSAISSAFEAVKSAISTAINWVLAFVRANWPLLLVLIAGPMGAVAAVVIKNWDTIKAGVSSALNAVLGVVKSVWSAVTGAVSSAVGAVTSTVSGGFNAVRNAVSSAMGALSGIVSGAWNSVRSIVSGGVSAVVGTVSGLVGAISRALSGVVGAFTAPFAAAAGAVNAIIGGIRSAVSAVAGVVSHGISVAKAPFNAFASVWNGISITLPKIDIPLGPTLGGGTIRLPRINPLAEGGIVWPQEGGVLALLAEAGRPERVTPLGADGMTAGETATVELLRRIAALLAAGTSVEIDGREVAAATAAATLFGVAG